MHSIIIECIDNASKNCNYHNAIQLLYTCKLKIGLHIINGYITSVLRDGEGCAEFVN